MTTIGLFYFSGTGNTKLVAEMIRDAFIKLNYSVDLIRMEDVVNKKTPLNLKDYDLIGFGSQVIGYGVPNLVKDFIKLLPNGNMKKVFVFRTAGGVDPINYNASNFMKRTLRQLGYDVFYERIFSIGSNWIRSFSDSVVHQLYTATQKKVELMVKELILGKPRFYKTDIFTKIGMGVVSYFSGNFFRQIGSDYLVTDACKDCGLCVKNCPAQNIVSVDGKIRFKKNCSGCLRCLYSCPKNAIQLKKYRFIPIPGGYNIKKTLERSLPENFVEDKQPKFFNRYITDENF